MQKAIWIDAGIHAREWLAPAVAMMLIQKLLLEIRQKNKKVISKTWYILPVANPDGYVYSRLHDRLWRKNRRKSSQLISEWHPMNGHICDGVDLNRNFGYKWNSVSRGQKMCSEDYHGIKPFSEPETKAMASFLMKNKNHMVATLSLHTYG